MSNFNQFDNVENAITVLVAGEVFAFYANLDALESSNTFDDWHLDLLFAEDFSVAHTDIGILTKDIISGASFRFYSEFTIPAGLTPGCYYLVIRDEFYDQVKYISNKLQYTTVLDYTFYLKFRNNKNILNFNYEGLLGFNNKVRVKLQKRQPQQDTTSIGYDLIAGNFNPVRYVKGKEFQFITLWYDEFDHDFFSAAIIHSSFLIIEDGAFVQYIRTEDNYEIDWNNNYPLAEGTIRLQRKNSYTSNKTL